MTERLSEYHRKRDFDVTGEPRGKETSKRKSKEPDFVVQKHGARRLHYDFRLEWDGVMKSWAVTRGPSFDPKDKRLAVRTEDHPIEYNKFEGVIPDKQYGAGPVMIWDKGTWIPDHDPHMGEKKGHLSFTLKGSRLQGHWHLVRMQGAGGKRENWLLIKGDDEYATKGPGAADYLDRENTSIISGRTLEEIRGQKDSAENNKPKKKKTGASMAQLEKKYPATQLATLVEFPPSGKDWLHELKYDGYRIMVFINDGEVVLRTRGAKDWTHKFTPLAEEIKKIPISSAVLDGEVGVLGEKGATSFSALQNALSKGDAGDIQAWVFDLLYLDGEDFSKKPLVERKETLERILKEKKLTRIHYSEHFESSPHLLDEACKVGAEGIISKNKNAPYRFRRTRDWLKSKCGLEQEFVIGGFMPAKDNPKAVGALLLGYYRGKELLYAGKVGTGFGREMAKNVHDKLAPLRVEKSPFKGKVERSRRRHYWVKPVIICEVAFWEWTADRHIRHASFKGVREDKTPHAVRKEEPEKPPDTPSARSTGKRGGEYGLTVEGVTITHPEREVYPGMGITKGDVAGHYARVVPYIMPFIENRLVSLLRCTETVNGECFFQRGPMKGIGGEVRGMTVTHNGNKHNYIYIDNPSGLLRLVQMGTIEFHAWQSRVERQGHPDQIIFDLDPGKGVPFEAVKLAAKDVRQRLKRLGLESFVRLTGGKGIHVAAAIAPRHGWNEIKSFTRNFALQMERDAPDAYIATMAKKKRAGKIFVDYLRNDFSATAIAPFSLRAREGAPVAVPVSWKELDSASSAADYTVNNIGNKLNKRMEKLIQEFFNARQDLRI